jgi:hypothetical protein
MKGFIEANKGLLKFYCVAARVIGWVLLLTLPVLVALILLRSRLLGQAPGPYPLPPLGDIVTPWRISLVMLGGVVLGVGQFIRYVFEADYRPGWILRHGAVILYAYAALNIVLAGHMVKVLFDWDLRTEILLMQVLFLLIPTLAQALLLVGLGRILRRVMPAIEESKTLV